MDTQKPLKSVKSLLTVPESPENVAASSRRWRLMQRGRHEWEQLGNFGCRGFGAAWECVLGRCSSFEVRLMIVVLESCCNWLYLDLPAALHSTSQHCEWHKPAKGPLIQLRSPKSSPIRFPIQLPKAPWSLRLR